MSLPYNPNYPMKPHIGDPVLSANPPFNPTTEHRDSPSLRMSSTATASNKRRSTPSAKSKHRSFLTAFALLAHSVAYLAWSQGVEGIGIPYVEDGEGSDSAGERARERRDTEDRMDRSEVRIPVTAVLQMLLAMSQSPGLGRKSHEPGTQHVRDLGFSLDVRQVVKSVLAADAARWEEGEQSEEWDLVDDT